MTKKQAQEKMQAMVEESRANRGRSVSVMVDGYRLSVNREPVESGRASWRMNGMKVGSAEILPFIESMEWGHA